MEAAAISTSKYQSNKPQLTLHLANQAEGSESEFHNIQPDLPNADVHYYPNFLSQIRADNLFQSLLKEVRFQPFSIKIYGKDTPIPRLQSWHGDEGVTYQYSGKTLTTEPWTPTLLKLKSELETFFINHFGVISFNSVLCNLYRDGQDSMGWHSDDEPELGQNPIIASISLGEVRPFKLQHKKDKSSKWQIPLDHGSLLIMAGETQHYWRHHIPKSQRPLKPRINLTFRWVY